MVSYVLNVDKVGDLKFGRKKCRLHKKSEVVQVAKDYGIPTPNKKTVSDLCGRLKKKIKEGERVSREEVKKILANQNNVPLAKLYPEAAKKRAAAKKKVLTPSMKAALKKKAVTNFMKGMVTTNANIKKLRELNEKPKPSKKAKSLTKDEARKRIKAMKGLSANNKFLFVNKLNLNQQSPRRVVRMAREMARLR
jgi:cation diffusion facilitator CzcD-associated flavoprotein CzcO|tara:strand:- start:656 stop:1237 length:582 start_codon:yes stop_codon:yes gene_type:complete